MTSDGYVRVDQLLNCPAVIQYQATIEQIQQIVTESDKQRFQLKSVIDDNGDQIVLIRANQGHSIKNILDDENLLQPITIEEINEGQFPICVHGTNNKALKLIQSSGGLSRMSRNHIHFSSFDYRDDRVISGMRSNVSVLIYINLAKALTEGKLKFYLSSNRVILSPGDENGIISNEYFDRIVHLKS